MYIVYFKKHNLREYFLVLDIALKKVYNRCINKEKTNDQIREATSKA